MFNLKKKDAVADEVAKILAQEAELSPKQKKIAKIAGDKDKIDAADFAALRAGKKPVEEGFDDMDKYLKDKAKPQPSGGAGKKQGSKYGGSKQKEEPKEDMKEDVESVDEKAPPGFEGTVKAMKKHKDIDNPFALAWSMKNKGYKSHKKADGSMKKEEVEELDEKDNTGRDYFGHDSVRQQSGYRGPGQSVMQTGVDAITHGAKAVHKAVKNSGVGKSAIGGAKAIKHVVKKVFTKEEVEQMEEAVSRKHFQQVADLIKSHDNAGKRKELAQHHAEIFKQQNPRFDHAKFMKAAGVNEEVGHVVEKVDPNVRTKETLTGSKPSKQKDDVGPGADGKSTKVKFSAESWLKELKKK